MTTDPCDGRQLLVQAELDNELDAAAAASLAAHVERCPDCAALQAELSGLSAQLKGSVTRYAAPASLRARVLAQRPVTRRRIRIGWSHAMSFGAGLAVAAAVVLAVLPSPDDLMPDTVAAHIRALQPGHLVDVASTDQHTVKPWFDGRIDFAPSVRNLAAQGFPLIGGRLDYLAGRPVAALVYGRDKHLIDVFIWPGDRSASSGTTQGYNLVAWVQGGMSYQAVSDLNMTELRQFARLMQALGA